MRSYGLPIDLEGAQEECTAIARHNQRATQLVAVREQMHGSTGRQLRRMNATGGRIIDVYASNGSLSRTALVAILIGLARFNSHKPY